MIVNKLKTTACWTATFVFVFAVLSMLMTFKAGAFSGLVYSDGVRADVSHNTDAVSGLRDTDDILSVSGPVNITLVLHGQVAYKCNRKSTDENRE